MRWPSSHINGSRIWIIRGGAIGDFILTVPVMAALRRHHPEAKLNIVANRQVAPLAVDAVTVTQLKFLDAPEFAPLFSKREGRTAGHFHPDDMVHSYLHDPDKIFEANVRACGVKHFHSGPWKIGPGSHAADQLAEPLQTLGVPIRDLAPRLQISETARKQAAQKLAAPAAIVIHPGSGSRRKNWPIAKWIQLVSGLLDRDIGVAIVGGEADYREVTRLRDHFRTDSVSIALDWPLRELAALTANRVFIGHDSGISHLAAATGAPSLILFGPTDPKIWAPKNANARVLRAPEANLDQLSPGTVRDALDQELIRIGIKT